MLSVWKKAFGVESAMVGSNAAYLLNSPYRQVRSVTQMRILGLNDVMGFYPRPRATLSDSYIPPHGIYVGKSYHFD
jgi:hypothetical protein